MQALQAYDAHAAVLDRPDDDSPSARARLQLVDPPVAFVPPPWQDKLQMVPAMRSALIPMDEGESAEWSNPFSLLKADFEPWLSYYTGYRSSRLFLPEAGSTRRGADAVDFPVRALLELKKVDLRFIFEPPVQIDAPVEYFDANRAPGSRRDPGLTESLTRAAEAMHRSQLRRAQERGRDMGNHLYEALLGEGLSNLIRAWEKVWQRKPTPHELHLMLTTGRVEPVKSTPAAPAAEVRSRATRVTAVPPAGDGSGANGASAAAPATAGTRGAKSSARAPASSSMRESLRANQPSQAGAGPTRGSQSMSPEPSESQLFKKSEASAGNPLRYLLHLAGAAGLGGLIYMLVV